MRLEFFMPMDPPKTTDQMHQVRVVKSAKSASGFKPVFFDSDYLAAARSKLTAHIGQHTPAEMLTGPLMLVTKWCWPCEGTEHDDGDWYAEKPDTHNVVKLPVDIMEKLGFFENDKRICYEVIQKFWARVPGIYICLEELNEG